MIIKHISLVNWRNFKKIDVDMGDRIFIVGPNASGKSNFLDAFRFMRDLVKPGGGLQYSINQVRGGVSKVRCLSARQNPLIEIDITLGEYDGSGDQWRYKLAIKQESRGKRQTQVAYEMAWKNDEIIFERPDKDDELDQLRLGQTYLEQINANKGFRPIPEFFESIVYLHLVPQLLRYTDAITVANMPDDPFGRGLLERIAKIPEKTRRSRLRRIEKALQIAVPQLKGLTDVKDEAGVPHLEASYTHWRATAAKQREDQFSDGTLRMIGLLWVLLDGKSTLLLEEPELSLNSGIVKHIPSMLYRLGKRRQVIVSTHSSALLEDKSIGGEEVIMLIPNSEGTVVQSAAKNAEIRALLDAGMSVAEAVIPQTYPKDSAQLSLFE